MEISGKLRPEVLMIGNTVFSKEETDNYQLLGELILTNNVRVLNPHFLNAGDVATLINLRVARQFTLRGWYDLVNHRLVQGCRNTDRYLTDVKLTRGCETTIVMVEFIPSHFKFPGTRDSKSVPLRDFLQLQDKKAIL